MIETALGCTDQLPPGLSPEMVRQNGKLLRAGHGAKRVVADTAGNSILQVNDGRVSLLAVIPERPAGSDQVPTSVARGRDGAFYVGTLAEGAGNGGANIWRVVPGRAPEVFASGLTAVVDVAFGPDGSLYASQFVTDWTSPEPTGAVVRIRPNGRRTVLGEGSLFLPGGLAVDRHGNLYVANWSILPATGSSDPVFPPDARGQVVRLRTR